LYKAITKLTLLLSICVENKKTILYEAGPSFMVKDLGTRASQAQKAADIK
jgi:hypothetical protein